MAKDAKAQPEAGEAAPAPRSKKKLLIIVLAVVVLLVAAAGGAAFFLLKNKAHDEGEDGEVATEQAKTDKKKGAKEAVPVYVALEPFTVNLIPETGDQFLQLVISVEVTDAAVGERLKTYTPKLRNNIMLLLSGKKASELLPKEGKEVLAGEIRALINKVLEPAGKNPDDGPVREVLFTSFIIQ